jgi:hypothetical protein
MGNLDHCGDSQRGCWSPRQDACVCMCIYCDIGRAYTAGHRRDRTNGPPESGLRFDGETWSPSKQQSG